MTRQIIRGLAVSLALAVSSYGASQQGGAARAGTDKEITIRIHNYSGANFSVVGHAERVADSILREAGVNTVWVECPVNQDSFHGPICAAPLSSLDFVVNLVPRSMSDHWHLGGGVLGLAIEAEGKGFGFSASIFYDVVRDCAKQRREDLDQILGTAIAHELGHLLLGTNSHSSSGLMSAFWSRKQLIVVQQRGLSFSSAEAELVQRAVLARRLAALSAAETSESVTFVPRSTIGTVEVDFAE
jgi:hypothetical protein